MKKFLIAFFTIIATITIFVSCEESNISNSTQNGNEEKYDINLIILCEENLLFSKYDTNMYIDDVFEGTINHGEKENFKLKLSEGVHTIRFEKKDDSSVYGTEKIKIKNNASLGYTIHCKNNKIEIKETDFDTNELNSSTNNDNNINYETNIETNIETTTSNNIATKFSKEYAKRAVITSITNKYSPYVFSSDGNSYDTTKFHSYSNTSYFYSEEYIEGIWEAIDETTWRVKDMKIKIKGIDISTSVKVSADISMAEEYLYLSKVTISQGTLSNLDSNDPNKLDIAYYDTPEKYTPYFYVPFRLIMEDRTNQTNENAILSNARLVFENHGKSLYPNGFECNWLLGTITKEIYADGSCYFMVESTITNNYGTKEKVLASGKVSDNIVYNFNIDKNY